MHFSGAKRLRRTNHNTRGQALVEFVPILMLLLTLMFMVIDLGRAIWQLEIITGLTREGSNLAARNVPLDDSAMAVVNDGSILHLTDGTNGRVIITSVKNDNGHFLMTGQYSIGNLSARSKVGTYSEHGDNRATLPVTTVPIPQPGETVYVTEIFNSFSPITPIGAFVKYTIPSTLYDVAYF